MKPSHFILLLLPLVIGCGGQKTKITDYRIQERLDTGDKKDVDGYYYDQYWFRALETGDATISLESEQYNPYMFVYDDAGDLIDEDDDGGYNDDARLTIRVTVGHKYRVFVTSKDPEAVGDYRLKTTNTLIYSSTINRGPEPIPKR